MDGRDSGDLTVMMRGLVDEFADFREQVLLRLTRLEEQNKEFVVYQSKMRDKFMEIYRRFVSSVPKPPPWESSSSAARRYHGKHKKWKIGSSSSHAWCSSSGYRKKRSRYRGYKHSSSSSSSFSRRPFASSSSAFRKRSRRRLSPEVRNEVDKANNSKADNSKEV